jgi:archaellum biogenesis ATPase FlaH
MNTEFDFDAKIEEAQYLVDGLLPFNSISFVLGRPGSGKSFVTEQLAISVITGQDFMGHKVKQGNVLLIDQDTGGNTVGLRLIKFLKYYANNLGKRYSLYPEIQKDYKISDNSLVDAINSYENISLVVIDSLHKITVGLNPNDTKDMSNIAKLRKCLKKDMAIVIVHHVGKSNTMSPEAMMLCEDATVLFMGNTAISAEADNYYIVTSPDAGKTKFEHLWIRPVVKRFALNQEAFIAKFEQNDSVYHLSFESLYENSNTLPTAEQNIVILFEQSSKLRTVQEVFTDLGGKIGINRVREALDNLEAKGMLICHTEAHNLFRYELANKNVIVKEGN